MTRTGVARDAGTVTGWNLVSRLSGFARVLVVGGALGATRLGDTHQAANQVSNLLFEFLAAGTLSAVLVPGITQRLVGDGPARAEAFAGAILARALVVLGALAFAGLLLARPIMDVLLSGNDAGSRAAQVRLGAFLLLFVMPQLLLYAWGAVTTAVLNANGHFAAGAAAPVANNLVVIATVGAFWLRDARGLDLAVVDRVLLGGGAFGGVLCMTLVPVVMARRRGLRISPRWATTESLAMPLRDVAWATVVVIPAQIFLFVAMVVSARVPGGVVATQFGFTLFLLPHALLGHPLTTVLFPRLARYCAAGDNAALQREAAVGLRLLLLMTAPAAALLVALAPWLLPAIAVGALARDAGMLLVAAALGGYGFGLTAYTWSLFTARIAYAASDAATPGLAALLGGAVGVVMLGVASTSEGTALLFRVGIAHSLMVATAAVATVAVLHRRAVIGLEFRPLLTYSAAAIGAGAVARFAADRLGDPVTRMDAFTGLAFGAAVGLVVYVAAVALAGVRIGALRTALP